MYLLDTHTLLWALAEPSRLGKNTYRIIKDGKPVLLASPASAWEIGTKHRLGMLPQADFLIAGYSDYLNQLGVQRRPITDRHAMVAGSMEWEHRDPFDRMLASQAILESLTLITCDSAFSTLRALKHVWCTRSVFSSHVRASLHLKHVTQLMRKSLTESSSRHHISYCREPPT